MDCRLRKNGKMKHTVSILLVLFQLLSSVAAQDAVRLEQATLAGDEKIATPFGTITLEDNYFSTGDSQKLYDAMDVQRACQAYIIGQPPWSAC